MIKIKDGVDLDKLVGFEKIGDAYSYESEDMVLTIYKDDRIVCIDAGGLCVTDCEIPSVLFDLFKAGFVEEVK